MNSTPPFLSIVIPAFNEQYRLPGTLERIAEYLSDEDYTYEIIVVTDGSTDDTANLARGFVSRVADLKVLEFANNRGKGFAVREGMLHARGSFRLFMDADYAVPVDFVTPCLDLMLYQQMDIVIGSRTAPGAKFEQSQPFIRQQLAVLFGVIQYQILRMPYRDTQCGFKLFTADCAEFLFPMMQYECAYFDAELIYIAHQLGLRIGEVGVTWRHDNETRLPIGISRAFDLLQKLIGIRSKHSKLAPEQVSSTRPLRATKV